MEYYIDLKEFSVQKLKSVLLEMDLIPSWMLLRDNIDANFLKLEKAGVTNIHELLNRLSTKTKIQQFANESGFDENYLTVLRRMTNGYKPKPVKLTDFDGVSDVLIQKLEAKGIKNTLQLYPLVLTFDNRMLLAKELGVELNEIVSLAKLSDLVRIRWVNHTFAKVLLASGFDTLQKIINANFLEVYQKVKACNEEQNLYKGQIGKKDMKLMIYCAKDLKLEMFF